MALSTVDYLKILSGFSTRFQMRERQVELSNPIKLQIPVNGSPQMFRLWCFEITHGGGGPTVRAANEYRVQITKGPSNLGDFDNGAKDILIGYARDKEVIVAYDRRWLRYFAQRRQEDPNARQSPSVQVKTEQINQAVTEGIYPFKKQTRIFGNADIVTLTPEKLPEFLGNYSQYLHQL